MCDTVDPLGQDLPDECLICGRKMPRGLNNICEHCENQENNGPQLEKSLYLDPEWDEDEEEENEEDEMRDIDESMDGDFDTGMRDAGFGTDEDYGYFGGDEY